MSDLQENIGRIQQKLKTLLQEHYALQKDNERLRRELSVVKMQESVQLTLIEQLQQQVEVLHVTSIRLSEEEKKNIEKKINQYIREIDRCVSLLSE